MIRHVVLITLKEDRPPDAVRNIIAALRGLPEHIEEILDYEVGEDVIGGENRPQIGLIGDFDDIDALNRYRKHPEHMKVVDMLIKPHLADIKAVDYEVESGA